MHHLGDRKLKFRGAINGYLNLEKDDRIYWFFVYHSSSKFSKFNVWRRRYRKK